MPDSIEWKSLDVTAAEGMTLRVGAFKASDGEVVEFSPDVLKKIFSKVDKPIPMYLTHKDAGTGMPREVLGHAVKLGLETEGDKVHYKALMMDPNFKLMYASGYDDTSAEITPIRDDAGTIIDGTLTGIAVVPNPAISGTQMRVSAVAFTAPTSVGDSVSRATSGTYQYPLPQTPGFVPFSSGTSSMPAVVVANPIVSSGGIRLTGKIEKTLLEHGVPADRVPDLLEGLEAHFSKKFEQAGLQVKLEEANKQLELACASEKGMKKKFEDLTKEFETHLGDKVNSLIGEVKTVGFANPEAVIDGLPIQQKITMLSKIKENMVAAKPPTAPAANLQAPPTQNSTQTPEAQLKVMLAEMGVEEMWNKVVTNNTPTIGVGG
jgi:hypothetical protein